jgi:S1-C subfamily serine protease
MKKIAIIMLACLTLAMQACAQKQPEPVKAIVPSEASESQNRLTLKDFTDVAAATIDAVVHIKTEMTQMTPLYQSFFGFIIPQGVQKQVYNAYGSGVIIT